MEYHLQAAAITEGTVMAFSLLILTLLLIVLFSPAAGRVFAGWAVLFRSGIDIKRHREDRSTIARLQEKKSSRRLPPAGVDCFFPTCSPQSFAEPGGGQYPASPWEKLVFNPVYLNHSPVYDYRLPGTGVIIGPNSRRPLSLKIPILLGGMAYKTLNAPAKQALALGATMAGTAANTGGGPFLPAERAAAEKLVVQYSRGEWEKDLEALLRADAIEIQLGWGPWAALPRADILNRGTTGLALREIFAGKPGERDGIPPRVAGIRTPAELAELIETLRRKTGGVPIGVKIGGTGFLEKELDLILRASPDFLAVAGLEGGFWDRRNATGVNARGVDAGDGSGGSSTHGSINSLASMGLPTLYLLVRTSRFLEERKLRGKVTLLAGGGLVTPVDFLKAMALGADAVFIGSAALAALVHPPASPFFRRLSIDKLFCGKGGGIHVSQAAHGLASFLKAAVAEMQVAALRMGKNHLREVGLADLSALDRDLAAYLGIGWCGGWREGPPYGQSRGYNFGGKED
ncbi:MAG: FMN-binding glutamate synthase family protein [Clostridia bacterium]|nr:FMN-binding glutamate synthase family protein [Clostridia bacterium]